LTNDVLVPAVGDPLDDDWQSNTQIGDPLNDDWQSNTQTVILVSFLYSIQAVCLRYAKPGVFYFFLL